MNRQKKKFLPVVVPNLQDEEFSVEVLFPGNDKTSICTFPRLMVIDSPTVKELTDVSYMIPILFHEIAHQFRYEKDRKIRNEALLDSVLYSYFSVIAEDLANEIICIMKETCDFASALKNGFKKAFIASFKETEAYKTIKSNYLECSFEEFIGNATYILREWYLSWTAQISLMGFLNDYIGKMKNHFSSNETTEQLVHRLYDINDEYIRGCHDRAQTVQKILRVIEEDINKNNNTLIFETSYKELSYALEGWSKAYSLSQSQMSIKSDELEKFNESLYKKMRTYWTDISQKSQDQYILEKNACTDYIPSYHYWTLIGRKLGLDYESPDNQKKFNNMIMQLVKITISYSDSLAYENVTSFISLYQEAASDLFMCAIMDLSEFAYLRITSAYFAPNESYHPSQTERLFIVFYTYFCYDKSLNVDEGLNKFYDSCIKLVNKIIAYGNKVSGINIAQDSTEDISNTDDKCDSLCDTIVLISDKFIKCRDNLNSDAKNELDSVLRMLNLLKDLITSSQFYYRNLIETEGVLNDFIKGKKVLKEFWKKAEEEGSNGENIMKEIHSVCSLIADALEDSPRLSAKRLNIKCLEVLLKMFYKNKIEMARTIGD